MDEFVTWLYVIGVGAAIFYFVIRFAIKNGIVAAYREITGKKTAKELRDELEDTLGMDRPDDGNRPGQDGHSSGQGDDSRQAGNSDGEK